MRAGLARALPLAIALSALPPWAARAEEPPRLVLLLVVDQLRRDRLDPELPGGLGRLAREGRVYVDAVLDHAVTQTCPGYVTLLSGRHPGPAGVPANSFVDRESGEHVYCVNDPADDARVLGGDGGRSPRLIRVTALGDWMKRARPETRVFSVSAKDRAAIPLGGQRPDAAYWPVGARGFTSSRYYMGELPKWVRAFNGADPPRDGSLARAPDHWEYPPVPSARRDDYPAESPDHSRTTSHPIRDSDPETFAENLYVTPFLDELTLDFATELLRRERLGRGPATDLLALALSATDTVGHLYGPESQEAHDALRRLDAWLDGFLRVLDSELGEGRTLVVLTADHGVLPLPEWLAETGRSTCPVEGGRIRLRSLKRGLSRELHKEFGPLLSLPKQWVVLSSAGLTVNRPLARERGVDPAEVVHAAKRYLEKLDAIERAWSAEEIANGDKSDARLYRNSFDPERSGDLVLQVKPTCLISGHRHGTSHGSPHLYDRAVPIVFFGPGVEAGPVPGPAHTVDIAPTLARLLGIPVPPDLDGRVLFD